jgi:transposase-like protein
VARISEELGIHVVTLYYWRKTWRLQGEVVPASETMTMDKNIGYWSAKYADLSGNKRSDTKGSLSEKRS